MKPIDALFGAALLKSICCFIFACICIWQVSELADRLLISLVYVFLNGLVGSLLFLGGKQSSASREFGLLFLLIASPYAGASISIIQRSLGPTMLEPFLHFQVEALAPYVFWKFASAYPASPVTPNQKKWLSIWVKVTVVVGVSLIIFNLIPYVFSIDRMSTLAGMLRLVSRFGYPSFYWPIVFAMLIPAIFFLVLRVPGSNPIAIRRLQFLALAVAVGTLPMLLVTIAHNVSDAARSILLSAENEPLTVLIVDFFMLSLPLTCAYSLMAHRVFSIKYVVTVGAWRFILHVLLSISILTPLVIAMLLISDNLERSLKEFLEMHGIELVFLACASFLLLHFRFDLRKYIDRLFLRNTFDTAAALVELSSTVNRAKSIEDFSEAISSLLKKTLHARNVFVLLLNSSGKLGSVRAGVLPLNLDSSILREVQAGHAVDFTRELEADTENLSDEAIFWLVDNEVMVVTKLGDVGAIAVGSKINDAYYSAEELNFLDLVRDSIVTPALEYIGKGELSPSVRAETVCCQRCGQVQTSDKRTCLSCGDERLPKIDLPEIVDDVYRLEKRIGQGAAGVVYVAWDVELERQVAVKTLPVMSAQQAIELKKEARMMAKFSHPNLAAVYGAPSYEGRPMMVMEYLENGTLSQAMKEGRSLDLKRVVVELCEALEFIHNKGLVHRDVKPANIGIGESGEMKLMDFGLGKFLQDRKESIEEQRGVMSGTISYLPPEAFVTGAYDLNTDLWAISILFHELLLGTHPFAATDQRIMIRKILSAEYSIKWSDHEIAEIFSRALSLRANERPRSAGELCDSFMKLV